MKIALIGATGFIGSKLLDEALARNHQVTALVSRPERARTHPNVTAVRVDVQNPDALAELLKGHDAVISAFSGHAQENTYTYYVQGFNSITAAVKKAAVPRLLVVGGAGSLEVAPGVTLVSTPEFPAAYKAEAEKGGVFLDLLRRETELDWTFLSPSALFVEGERTGKFRLGGDQLLTDAAGKSWISFEDYAVALADEIERPAHSQQRFTVGY